MQIELLKDKKCFIYPFSNSTEVLKTHLDSISFNFQGFIDKNVTGKNILKLNEIISRHFDYILIYSPNHEKVIYTEVVQHINKDKIVCVRLDILNNSYSFLENKDSFEETFSQKDELFNYFLTQPKNVPLNANIVLLIGIDFIDLNIKYLYLYLKKHSHFKVYLASNNQRDIATFSEYGINVVDYNSKEFVNLALEAAIKIVDHNPVEPLLIETLKRGKCVQLWHGITIETLGVLTNYKILTYDIVLSTSAFVSDYSFSKIYDYKEIIHCGYPRNDVLRYDDIELINVDLDLLNGMKNDSFQYIVYMPTHRPLSFKSNPIEYQKLNDFAQQNNLKIIIKMHPFVAQKIRDDLSSYQNKNINLTHLIIYESHMDIYPLLKYSDMLISDYSSVYFDYLYVNKPILFFCYDYEEWVRGEQGIILDYFTHSPGDKCYDFDELLKNILKNLQKDDYKAQRKILFDKMFENQTSLASQCIDTKLQRLLNQ
jgi:CDP-glycerol glycerophosphotransferase (TagB/SpsB family)